MITTHSGQEKPGHTTEVIHAVTIEDINHCLQASSNPAKDLVYLRVTICHYQYNCRYLYRDRHQIYGYEKHLELLLLFEF